MPDNILEEALQAVTDDRAKNYGPIDENFQRIADLWKVILSLEQAPTTAQVALCLIAVKISRLCRTPSHHDSWVDIAGYAYCGHQCATPKALSMQDIAAMLARAESM